MGKMQAILYYLFDVYHVMFEGINIEVPYCMDIGYIYPVGPTIAVGPNAYHHSGIITWCQ